MGAAEGRPISLPHPDFSEVPRTSQKSLGFRFGRNLVEMDPRSLPQLSKQLRDQNNSRKLRKKKKIEILKIRK